MQPTSDLLTAEYRRIGKIIPERKLVVTMLREEFLAVVRRELDSVDAYEAIRDEMEQTAAQMDVFPFGAWIAFGRGCGCVVGEYLVAAKIIDREQHAAQIGLNVEHELARLGQRGQLLKEFGRGIDTALRQELADIGVAPTVDAFVEKCGFDPQEADADPELAFEVPEWWDEVDAIVITD